MAPELQFNVDDAQAAADAWGFNCGPAALCALFKLAPTEIRPKLEPFKGYLSPTTMRDALRRLDKRWTETIRDRCGFPAFGLVRVQFDGPWCKPGVPIAARYQHTHWVASDSGKVFDINATCAGWLEYSEWANDLMPWLLRGHKRATGEWWTTHALEMGSSAGEAGEPRAGEAGA